MASVARRWLALAVQAAKAAAPRAKRGWAWAKEHRAAIGRAGAHLGLVGSFAFLVLLVHRAVYSALSTSPRYRLPESTARVAPTWADGAGAEGVVTIPAGGLGLFDEGLVARVAESFESNPWVRRVTSVERCYPDQVRVKFEMRVPRLAVRRSEGAVLVDADGVRLPGIHGRIPPGVLEVTGVASAAPGSGRRWEQPEIASALEMASLVEGEGLLRRFGIRAVDVANLNGRRTPREAEIALQAASGAWIAWGRSPSSTRYGEPSVPEKLDNLRLAAENYPNLEGLASVKVHQRGSPRCVTAGPDLAKKPPRR